MNRVVEIETIPALDGPLGGRRTEFSFGLSLANDAGQQTNPNHATSQQLK